MTAPIDTEPRRPPASASQARYGPGTLIADRYELRRILGEGGIGQVWVAQSLTLHNDVALKLFPRAGADDGAERLLREARAAAALEHAAIVRVFDYGVTIEGDPFIVMELLRGESLEDMIARTGKVSATKVLRLLLPIIDALAVAHAKDIIHRDIKPANLFVSVDESERVQPKVIDFGLAKIRQGGHKVTQEGTLVGSPAYMSPEQIRGLDLDGRTDIWSLCVVIHELVFGQLPFGASSQFDLFKAIVESEPSPMAPDGEADDELIRIIRRGLAKHTAERWATMHELGTALAHWLVVHGVEEDACGTSLRRKWLARNASSLRPPTPVTAFVPPGVPRAPADIAMRETQEADESVDVVVPMPPDPRRQAPTLVLERPRPRRRFGALFVVGALVLAGASAIGLFVWRARPGVAQTTNAEPRAPAVIEPEIGATFTATAAPVASTAAPIASGPATATATAWSKATATPRAAPSASAKKRRDTELGF